MSNYEILEPNNKKNGIHDYRDTEIRNKTISIGSGDVADSFIDVRFHDCEIIIKSSGSETGVILHLCSFDNCVVNASKIQKIAKIESTFNRCSFKGKYEVGFYGEVSTCDFSKAILNQCLFFKINGYKECAWPSDGHLLISGLTMNREDFMNSVPKMSILWLMTKKNPEVMVLNKSSLKKVDSDVWEKLEQREYVIKL